MFKRTRLYQLVESITQVTMLILKYRVFPVWFLLSVCLALFGQTGELVVAQDGTGNYSTVQEAIMAVPDMRSVRTVIRIKPGVYKEKLVLPDSKTNVSFIGEDARTTILTYDDYASKKKPVR
ncbi:pectinesterase family protein [Parapedobacter sp. ISTM3]|uniref:pectinesterase family protein n=1 Tax=Parapedobacter sp. ISTM3 TaxID=2800130 RepID=UPI00210705B5|nr:pectinesterase family protein [Parapedobacter sp. ISTM3]